MPSFIRPRKERLLDEVRTVSLSLVRPRQGSVAVAARLDGETWKEVAKFAREKGYFRMNEILSLLFSYGVSDREGVDVKKRRSEMIELGRKYSAMRFRAHELFSDNQALTMALSTMLRDNRRLRKLAEEKGLIPAGKEEWDEWNEELLDGFYRRYVFVR
jgi:hypothetical protein